ncbi:uroporphyrinogen-III synthase [Gilliamella bombicola]|uniref:Uroporphyrinogen-III synthase n=1 Tax=Gilliamella bombicola TaxID=1798182 RepID=A0A1C4CKL6_9GAMM|nr:MULTISPECIES: uroporphyrinogen-III synthase [Gilliamella]NUF26731.1 uroporphyrinogen-III synthase [Gilliamella sp. ESL0254]SCC19543.1 uroporphyrinogen-III synthase [Gilliamella bombicola]
MIYVTRPSPNGEELTKQLNQAHLPATHLPLFDILPSSELVDLQQQLNRLLPSDIVIALSPQVIHTIKAHLPDLYFPKHVHYFAIGNKTAHLLSQLTTTKVSSPKQEDSEGLLDLLKNTTLAHRTVLILRGNSGRQLLADTLTTQQAQVKLLACYHRKPITYCDNILANNINNQIIIITSVEHLIQLELYCQRQHKQQAQLVVTSERILKKAQQLNWQNVLQIVGANNQILFKTMLTLCHNANINFE